MYLNPSDKLDQFLLRELEGDAIPFDEWDEFLEDLTQDSPSLEEQLTHLQITMEEVPILYRELCQEFQRLATMLGYPLPNRYLCCLHFSQISDCFGDHLRFITMLLSDETGEIWTQPLSDTEEAIQEFLAAYLNALNLEHILLQQQSLAGCWTSTYELLRRKPAGTMEGVQPSEHELFNLYQSVYQSDRVSAVLLENFALLLSDISYSPILHQLAPLYLYQMIVKHASRLHKNTNLTVCYDSLWKPTTYRIDQDNGKNFQENERRLLLFQRLCELFERDVLVDLPLCGWGFRELSNLDEFYRENLFVEKISALPTALEELLDETGFSCFPGEARRSVLPTDGSFTKRQIQRFQESRTYRSALRRISRYMNRHGDTLAQQFLETSPQDIRSLCIQILHDSNLPPRMHPKNMLELTYFTYSINEGLLDLVDYFAEQLLLEGLEKITSKSWDDVLKKT